MYRQPYLAATPMMSGGRSWPRVAYQRDLRYMVPAPVRRAMPRGGTYLGEDATYYYWMEPGATNQLNGFFDNIGNMFTRMVKFTPKSFTPGNIYKGFVNTTLTVASGGIYQVLPKDLKKTVYEVGKVAIPVVAGGALALAAGPAVMSTLMPKLSAAAKLLGMGGKVGPDIGPGDYGSITGESRPGVPGEPGAIDKTIAIGGELMNLLGRLPQNKQAEVIQQLTPEDIAYMETYKAVPPRLQPYFDQMAQSTFNPPVPSSGAASLYDAYGPPAPVGPKEAGMFAGLDMSTILMFAVPLGFYLLTSKGSRR